MEKEHIITGVGKKEKGSGRKERGNVGLKIEKNIFELILKEK